MVIIEYFASDKKEHWLSEISKSDWGAGKFLFELLRDDRLKELTGEATQLLLLTDGDNLVSFCTLSPMDDIQPTDLTPWIGFVFTFPEYRGNHYAGKLIKCAEKLAASWDFKYTYISTDKEGLYEKYGYEFYKLDKAVDGVESRVYRKELV